VSSRVDRTIEQMQRETNLCIELLRGPVCDLLAVDVPAPVISAVLLQLLLEVANRDPDRLSILTGAIETLRWDAAN